MASSGCKTLGLAALALLLAVVVDEVSSVEHFCYRDDPKLEECVKRVVEDLRPLLREGVAAYDVPPLEALNIGNVSLVNLPTLKAEAINVILSRISNFHIDDLQVNLKKGFIELKVTIPEAKLRSLVTVKTKVIVPVDETGPVVGTAANAKATVKMDFKVVKHRGQNKLFFPSVKAKLEIPDYSADFRPDEKPPKPLTQAVNSVINNERNLIVANMIPSLEKVIAQKLLDIANTVVKNFTYDELFPEGGQ